MSRQCNSVVVVVGVGVLEVVGDVVWPQDLAQSLLVGRTGELLCIDAVVYELFAFIFADAAAAAAVLRVVLAEELFHACRVVARVILVCLVLVMAGEAGRGQPDGFCAGVLALYHGLLRWFVCRLTQATVSSLRW